MPLSFAETLVVGISSRALFDLEEENKLFQEQGVIEYRKPMFKKSLILVLQQQHLYTNRQRGLNRRHLQ
jgi:hypothetical protein